MDRIQGEKLVKAVEQISEHLGSLKLLLVGAAVKAAPDSAPLTKEYLKDKMTQAQAVIDEYNSKLGTPEELEEGEE